MEEWEKYIPWVVGGVAAAGFIAWILHEILKPAPIVTPVSPEIVKVPETRTVEVPVSTTTTVVPMTTGVAAPVTTVTEEVPSSGMLYIIVQDDEGFLVEGATVEVNGIRRTSNSNGMVILDGMMLGKIYQVKVSKKGYEDVVQSLKFEKDGQSASIVLPARRAEIVGVMVEYA
jgi:hypothetical protein